MISLNFWLSFLILTMGYAIIRMFIKDLGNIFSKETKIKDLKQGMILTTLITKSKKKNILIKIDPSGINKEDLKKIKDWAKKTKTKSLQIQETICFAPFIFLGSLITILLKGNIVVVMLLLFS